MNKKIIIIDEYKRMKSHFGIFTRLSIILALMYPCQHVALGQTIAAVPFEKNALEMRRSAVTTSASSWFDVTYYKLELNITTNPNYLSGKVTIGGSSLQNKSTLLSLDLENTMRVDSVLLNGKKNAFQQTSHSCEITLDRAYQTGEILSADIYYQGTPVASGFGSFVFYSHSNVPWVYSLSEPFGASDWWPCKNNPGDKADSADIIVTCDSIFKVGSQGILVSAVNRGNGRSTYHWKERYPIAAYLISVSMTNYVQFSNWYRYSPADSMEVLNYVLPEHYSEAQQALPRVVEMLAIYSDMFGQYPFIKEKYGHAEFGSGGMEHQTMTSLGTFDEDVIAHELAHQWFGDMITCRTWSDLWLNEGFAQYCTALYREKKYGVSSYWNYMNPQLQRGMMTRGVIGAPDTTTPSTLFYSPLMYSKGASVLHMLRHTLGDSLFYRSLFSYANDPLLKYSTATTKDFQTVCENVSKKDLAYFFQEWIYGENIPSYEYSWEWKPAEDSSMLTIKLRQPADRTNPKYFIMPIDFRISANGRDTTVTLFNNTQSQIFRIRFPVQPVSVLLDPDGWILKKVFFGSDILPVDFVLEQNYPNPFNPTTTIQYSLPVSANVTLAVFDLLGRKVATIVEAKQLPGSYEYHWTPESSASGVYICRLTADGVRLQKKMILIR